MQTYVCVPVTALNADPLQEVVCVEKECQTIRQLKNMSVWSYYMESEGRWRLMPFCSYAHLLMAFPRQFLNKA